LFSIVDMMSVNGAAFRQVRVACETLTGVFTSAITSVVLVYRSKVRV